MKGNHAISISKLESCIFQNAINFKSFKPFIHLFHASQNAHLKQKEEMHLYLRIACYYSNDISQISESLKR